MDLPELPHVSFNENKELLSRYTKARVAFSWQELNALRDGAIGSQALIRLVACGNAPESLATALFDHPRKFYSSCQFVITYVAEVALAHAALGLRGSTLPPAPTAPDTIDKVLVDIERTTPDWKLLWEYVEKERASGALAHDAAWQTSDWRARLEKVLSALNSRFIDQVAQPLMSRAEEELVLSTVPRAEMDKALALIRPLSASLASAASCAASSRGLLEALRQRGQAAFDHLGLYIREEANALVKKAARAGERRTELLRFASKRYMHASAVPSQIGVAHCNGAAVDLMLKDYVEAEENASSAVYSCDHHDTTPPTFHARRDAAITSLRLGGFPDLPASLVRPTTEAQKKADEVVAWKSHSRLAAAHAGLCRKEMNKNMIPSPQMRANAEWEHGAAIQSYKAAHQMKPDDITPTKDMMALTSEFEKYRKRWGDN